MNSRASIHNSRSLVRACYARVAPFITYYAKRNHQNLSFHKRLSPTPIIVLQKQKQKKSFQKKKQNKTKGLSEAT
ncbi:hypothetical protein HYC85_027721 [Camellia sinensis]|uniref:Uncharacterized protein n=1 Tax=Camellia sinensis TaxID=4442 RepID=A0A7J7FT29_CAMSI|nr:hypothetical protein HYC85_027721 [Camellia sinensis]